MRRQVSGGCLQSSSQKALAVNPARFNLSCRFCMRAGFYPTSFSARLQHLCDAVLDLEAVSDTSSVTRLVSDPSRWASRSHLRHFSQCSMYCALACMHLLICHRYTGCALSCVRLLMCLCWMGSALASVLLLVCSRV